MYVCKKREDCRKSIGKKNSHFNMLKGYHEK